ncbi:hypothetical protein [Marinicrinis lubricantis]|uniref:Right handed beta helix domain-containing protein n=1 Tax=Marinicrinis lubricantis TaxID=2086470 RepID=A0ABW1IUY5_9BACL
MQKIVMMFLVFALVFTGMGFSFGTPVSYAASSDVYVASGGDDTTGDGTLENPYATLSKAYAEVNTGGTIYIKDDITLLEDGNGRFLVFDKGKNITITTAPESTELAVIQRGGTGGSGVGTLIDIKSGGQLTLKNIIFDGKGETYQSNGRIINVSSTLVIEEGTILRNNNSIYGGTALYLSGSDAVIEMSGGVITDNKFSGSAGSSIKNAIYIASGTFNMTGGKVIDNSGGGELISREVSSLFPATHASRGIRLKYLVNQ